MEDMRLTRNAFLSASFLVLGRLFIIHKCNKNTLKCIIWNDFLHISL